VVDTNVVVAALLTADAASPPACILDRMLTGRVLYLLSPALLAEYRTVLLRPTIRDRHGLTVEEIDLLLEELVAGAIWREPGDGPPAPDPGDDHLWALAGCRPGACLVTGDRLLLDNPPEGVKVVTPRQFLDSPGCA
jgi:putative PIN family toxin of toxin-antitoxin system